MKTINDHREQTQVPSLYLDSFANKAANDYAQYLLDEEENPEQLALICKDFHVQGEIKALVGFAMLEEEEEHQGTLAENMMDAHGLLLELEEELNDLGNSEFTHIGVGFAFNKNQVKVVELLSKKHLMINQLQSTDDGGVEVRGIVLNKNIGLYAARIVSLSKIQQGKEKDLYVAGPHEIVLTKSTGNFQITFPNPPITDGFYHYDDLKVIQFFIRESKIDAIKYGEALKERINFNHLKIALSLPMELIPDPRTVLEDAADMEREARDRELRAKRAHEEQLIKQAERLARQAEREKQRQAMVDAKDGNDDESGDGSGSQSKKSRGKSGSGADSKDMSGEDGQTSENHSESEEEDEEEEDSEESDGIEDLPSQTQMKRDLI